MKDIILKVITGAAGIALVIGMSLMDSEDIMVPAAMVLISSAWLLLFFSVNEKRYGR